MLPLKFKPRDSSVAFSDDEDTSHSAGTSLSAMPQTLTSASSLNSDIGDDLIHRAAYQNLIPAGQCHLSLLARKTISEQMRTAWMWMHSFFEMSIATPTRWSKDWPMHPHVPTHISPVTTAQLQIASEKSGSRSLSNSSVITVNSPTIIQCQVVSSTSQWLPVSPLHSHSRPVANDKLEHSDKEFVEINQIESGEFGKVPTVQSRNGSPNSVWAVKWSKPFEGSQHR
ncbi:hypothetical protein JVU11DRAFT_10990 [Chiua virens]|nr:hypothetical protein JVU11DRAFT_10990 [Chiua virens]